MFARLAGPNDNKKHFGGAMGWAEIQTRSVLRSTKRMLVMVASTSPSS